MGASAWAEPIENLKVNFDGIFTAGAPGSYVAGTGEQFNTASVYAWKVSNSVSVSDGNKINTDGHLLLCNGNVTFAFANMDIQNKDVVNISFNVAFGGHQGTPANQTIRLLDADNNIIVEEVFLTYTGITSSTTGITATQADLGLDGGWGATGWANKVNFAFTFNYEANTLTLVITKKDGTSTVEKTIDIPSGKGFVNKVYLGSDNQKTDRGLLVDDIVATTTKGDYSSTRTITLAFQDEDENDIAHLYTGLTSFVVEKNETFNPSDYYPTYMYDGDYRYTYSSGGASFTVTDDATVTLIYTKGARPTHTIDVVANFGTKNKIIVDAIAVSEATDYTYYYPRFILDGTTLYEYSSSTDANASDSYWNSTVSSIMSNVNYTLSYEAIEGDCVYYSEGENIEGATTWGYADYKPYMSNGNSGAITSATTITTLGAGTYTVVARAIGRANDRYVDIYKTSAEDENKVLRVVSQNKGGIGSATFTLTENTDIIVSGGYAGGSSGHACDYIYIMQIPDQTATIGTYGYATFSSTYALDFTSVTDATAYIATDKSGENILLQSVTGKVAANTGLVLKSTSGSSAIVNIPVAASGTSYNTESDPKNYLFALDGSFSTLGAAGSGTNYVLSVQSGNVVFAPIGATAASVSAGHAALWLPEDVAAQARTLNLSFENESTGISSIAPSTLNSLAIFNLSGQRIEQPSKGIYIVGGKKIIVK